MSPELTAVRPDTYEPPVLFMRQNGQLINLSEGSEAQENQILQEAAEATDTSVNNIVQQLKEGKTIKYKK